MSSGDGDKRKVSTDALETLGTIIDDSQKRDAIHLAVCPVMAKHTLRPGQDVGSDGGLDNPVGIVDPFLKEDVKEGEWFWLVIYPRQINSLRHVWSHPAFEEGEVKEVIVTGVKNYISAGALGWVVNEERESARKWLEDYVMEIDRENFEYFCEGKYEERISRQENLEDLISSAKNFLMDEKKLFYSGSVDGVDDKFWHHFEIYTGIRVDPEKKVNFFTCAC